MAETTSLVARIARVRDRGLRVKHALFEGGKLRALHCKGCGVQIAGLIPDDRYAERAVVNGRQVIRERMVFSYFANYREALLTFSDGSRHVCNACAECAPKLADDAVAEDFYAMDVSQWVSEGARIHRDHTSRTGAKLARVAPVITE